MDDAAILAKREELNAQKDRLLSEKEQVSIELNALPLTTTEFAEAEKKRIKKEKKEKCMNTAFCIGLFFFIICTLIGTTLYIIAYFTGQSEGCPVPFFTKSVDYPEHCDPSIYYTAIAFILIGTSPIWCTILAGMGHGGGC